MGEEIFVDEVVYVIAGKHKGRIGYCDDKTPYDSNYVYFGDMLLVEQPNKIPNSRLRLVNVNDLLIRREELYKKLFYGAKDAGESIRNSYLEEYILVISTLTNRLQNALLQEKTSGKKVFISYSSKDRELATWISVDLTNYGCEPWLDEWKISVGESIPQAISTGINLCDYLIVILSINSVVSNWVEKEWHTKYWAEVESGEIKVLPVVIDDCEIPTLLKTKKYADFRISYKTGLDELINAIKKH